MVPADAPKVQQPLGPPPHDALRKVIAPSWPMSLSARCECPVANAQSQ
jgi:hypothetical protein